MTFNGRRLLFVNTHLASGYGQDKRRLRIEQYLEVETKLRAAYDPTGEFEREARIRALCVDDDVGVP